MGTICWGKKNGTELGAEVLGCGPRVGIILFEPSDRDYRFFGCRTEIILHGRQDWEYLFWGHKTGHILCGT